MTDFYTGQNLHPKRVRHRSDVALVKERVQRAHPASHLSVIENILVDQPESVSISQQSYHRSDVGGLADMRRLRQPDAK